jgi:hypothetical protein
MEQVTEALGRLRPYHQLLLNGTIARQPRGIGKDFAGSSDMDDLFGAFGYELRGQAQGLVAARLGEVDRRVDLRSAGSTQHDRNGLGGVFPASRAASVTRDLRSWRTSTGRVRLQMMRSPSSGRPRFWHRHSWAVRAMPW